MKKVISNTIAITIALGCVITDRLGGPRRTTWLMESLLISARNPKTRLQISFEICIRALDHHEHNYARDVCARHFAELTSLRLDELEANEPAGLALALATIKGLGQIGIEVGFNEWTAEAVTACAVVKSYFKLKNVECPSNADNLTSRDLEKLGIAAFEAWKNRR
jgi:hypothetical protein